MTPTHNRWYTAQYSTRRDLPDGFVDDLLQRDWPAWSAEARRETPCVLDLAYGAHPRQTIDLFPNPNSDRWIFFIHGGYWKAMHGSASHFLAPPLVARGFNVAMPSYRLCPETTIGGIIADCTAALAWLSRHGQEHGAGCAGIVVAGHSAGGHLAAALFTVNWPEHGVAPELIRGGVGLSGLYDLDPIRQCEMNDVLGLTPADVPAWSPARRSPTVDAPLVLAAGERESSEFHRQMAVLAGAPGWDAVVRATVSLSTRHHFDLLDDFVDGNGVLWRALIE